MMNKLRMISTPVSDPPPRKKCTKLCTYFDTFNNKLGFAPSLFSCLVTESAESIVLNDLNVRGELI
jgi:hypothetical protein